MSLPGGDVGREVVQYRAEVAPDGLIGDHDPAFRQQIFDVAEACVGGLPGQIPAYASGNEPSMSRVGLGFEPDADDEDEDHLIKPLIAHVYKTLGSIALRPHESNLGGTQQLHPVFRVAFLDH
jgi:hypothetical protein